MRRTRHWAALLYPLCFFLLSPVMELLNRPMGRVYHLAIALDEKIPFIPQFVLTYHSWMPSLLLTSVLFWLLAERAWRRDSALEYDKSPAYLFFRDYVLALIVGQGLAHLTFPFFQTYVPRYHFTHEPANLFEALVKQTYLVDNPYCGFPSIHVLTSCIAIIFIWKSPLRVLYKFLISAHFTAIIASTLLIKQHVFWDLPGGVVYAVIGIACLPLSRRLATAIEERLKAARRRRKRPADSN